MASAEEILCYYIVSTFTLTPGFCFFFFLFTFQRLLQCITFLIQKWVWCWIPRRCQSPLFKTGFVSLWSYMPLFTHMEKRTWQREIWAVMQVKLVSVNFSNI
jgi:hypothetical protein